MINCIIFDLDGTLCDTLRDLAEATNVALAGAGYPTHPVEAYKQMVGNGITRLMERALPADAVTARTVAALRETMLAYYDAHLMDYTAPYPGMTALIDRLADQGKALFVVTNKPDAQAKAIVRACFPGRFRAVYGQVPAMPTKPDPWAVDKCLAQGPFSREEALFVGDSNVDVATARAAGLDCAGVSWGFRGRRELIRAGARWVADEPGKLAEIVEAAAEG
jgi:phosphoglycolate phosphatase